MTDISNDSNDQGQSDAISSSSIPSIHRQSLRSRTGRRSTMILPARENEPLVENPFFPEEYNLELREEYESLQKVNNSMEQMITNFGSATERLQKLSETVNQTDKLLDIWLSILKGTEETKALMEDPSFNFDKQPEKRKEPSHPQTRDGNIIQRKRR